MSVGVGGSAHALGAKSANSIATTGSMSNLLVMIDFHPYFGVVPAAVWRRR
jgi:hypothetical protein